MQHFGLHTMSLQGGLAFTIVVAILVAGLRAECLDCNDSLDFLCTPNTTGIFCKEGSSIMRVSDQEFAEDLHLLYPGCEPTRTLIRYVNHYCCIFSPEKGCQVALNFHTHDFEPVPKKYCSKCKSKCHCGSYDGATTMQIWHWTSLCGIAMLALR